MKPARSRRSTAIAYLAVADDERGRFFGGLLLIDRFGRPLEFHCTAPVEPSPAHRLLYGPTLLTEVAARQIAPALLRHAKAEPSLVLTDCPQIVGARGEFSVPMLFVADASQAGSGQDASSLGEVTGLAPGACVKFHTDYPSDETQMRRVWTAFADHVDIAEPLERIRGALEAATRQQAA